MSVLFQSFTIIFQRLIKENEELRRENEKLKIEINELRKNELNYGKEVNYNEVSNTSKESTLRNEFSELLKTFTIGIDTTNDLF
uniref:Uncharacterized protein n=1 Tax=Parastrongyloides trichosuri TaxID=131310 RepID=A0A0N4ZQK1_PARTI